MKKILCAIAMLAIMAPVFAQTVEKTEFTGYVGETTVSKQSTYTPDFRVDGKNAKVRNVILLIGDGMGLAAVNAGMYANGGELTLTNLHTFGFVRTQSDDNFTTDSAASGTAYATGKKTTNGFVGMDPGKNAIPNIPEMLSPLGYACGVVSTDDLNGATPASFFAHQDSRNKTDEIWADLPSACLDFVSAGSTGVFAQRPEATRNAIEKRYNMVGSLNEVDGTASPVMYLPPSVALAERGDYLPATTRKAIEYLSKQSKKGFFLMVEGARIDKEEHSNNTYGFVREMLDFDKAIEEAIRFAEKDGHTLVLISADHETGGVALRGGDPEKGFIRTAFASTGHTAITVPIYAYGPQSKNFQCFLENSDVANKILEILGGKKLKK
ncbi:MAG: alkaline phosphatase [Bacteroidales bacterium]|nr:alkaline phosphatase [Bacteroidales bacterium]